MQEPGFLNDTFRTFFTFLDSIFYWLLKGIYNVFFTVSTAEILSGDTLNNLYSRIQLIIGIFMIFKLSISILGYITNPDSAMDKQKGAGSLIMRIAVALAMLALVIPMNNIPDSQAPEGSLNYQIKNNGVLFGFLNQFQYSILQENIIGKLILGNTSTTTVDASGNVNTNIGNISNAGDAMASVVAQSFIRLTLKSSVDENNLTLADMTKKENAACEGYAGDNYKQADYQTLLSQINETCIDDSNEEKYVYDYTPVLGLICAAIMTVIVLGFTLDVAIRAVKLALLRVLAPIPIISYITPGAEKDGAFGNWVKTLTSTYIDLFIRIAIIYFGARAIKLIAKGSIEFPTSTNFLTTLLARIFVIIGILFFMKQAPKFLKDMLGIKGNPMGNVGIAGIMGGAAALVGGAGIAGAAAAGLQNLQGSSEAAAQGKSFGLGWGAGSDYAAQLTSGGERKKGGVINNMVHNATQRAQRAAGAKGLQRMGITQAGMNISQQKMYEAKDTLKDMELAYQKGPNASGVYEYKDYSTGKNVTVADEQAMRDAIIAQTSAAAKAEKNFSDADELAKKYGIKQSKEDKYAPSITGRARNRYNAIRHPITHSKDRKVEKQSVKDRISGDKTWKP